MHKTRKLSSTTYPMLFLLIDVADHITGIAGLTPTVTISKNGGSFASPSGAVASIGNGWYTLAGNATDRNTLGHFIIHASNVLADPSDTEYVIVDDDYIGRYTHGLVVTDGGNSATQFKTDLGFSANNAPRRMFLQFETGSLAGELDIVTIFNASTLIITVAHGFTGTPAAGDKFKLVNV